MISLVILFCAYSFVHGWSNAVLYSMRGYNAFKGDEHFGLTIERSLVWILPLATSLYSLSPVEVLICMISGACMFPFFHNGSYYHFRGKIDGSYVGWWDYTKGSTSSINFKLLQRTLLMIIGILILIIYYIV